MGKYDYLLGKSKTVKIGDDTFEVKQLNARNLSVFMGNKDDANMPLELVTVSLQQTDESITYEDVADLPLSIFQDVAEEIMKVNGLK